MLEVMASLTENFIFIYLGVSLFAFHDELEWDVGFILLTFMLLVVTRALHIFPLIAAANCRRRIPIRWDYQIVIWFSGLRGAIAFALSLLYEGEHHRLIRTTTLVCVCATTLGFGTATAPLLQQLNLVEQPKLSGAAAAGHDSSEEELPPHPDGVHAWWLRFDERYMQPLFGAEPRANSSADPNQPPDLNGSSPANLGAPLLASPRNSSHDIPGVPLSVM